MAAPRFVPGFGGRRARLGLDGREPVGSTRRRERPAGRALERSRLEPGGRGSGIEVRYRPVFEVPSGRLIGADAIATSVLGGAEVAIDERERAATIAGTIERVLAELAEGPAAVGGWWVRVGFGLGPLVDRVLAHEIAHLRAASPAGDRLRIGVREADLALALVAGGVGHLVGDGPGVDVEAFTGVRVSPSSLASVPVSAVRVRVDAMAPDQPADLALVRSVVEVARAVGVDVIAQGVDTDEHLELVVRAGVEMAQGFRWGSPGSLEKLLALWSRPG